MRRLLQVPIFQFQKLLIYNYNQIQVKIYTKTGDEGNTSLFGGTRVAKDDLRIEAYGTADELNSFIALLISSMEINEKTKFLLEIQNNIFVIGSMLSMPSNKNFNIPEIKEVDIEKLELEIDSMELILEPLANFILPPGNKTVSLCHICRTISRRTERRIVTLDKVEIINPLIIKYLNRLSDFFFVLSRYLAKELGVPETIWKPNK